jgi:hypothetical protein
LTARAGKLSATTRERLREMAERRLSAEEVRDASLIPISEQEREEVLSLVRWSCRRYPRPLGRLAYVRKAYLRWSHPRSQVEGSG